MRDGGGDKRSSGVRFTRSCSLEHARPLCGEHLRRRADGCREGAKLQFTRLIVVIGVLTPNVCCHSLAVHVEMGREVRLRQMSHSKATKTAACHNRRRSCRASHRRHKAFCIELQPAYNNVDMAVSEMKRPDALNQKDAHL